MNEPTITVMYSCFKCGLKDREVIVRERAIDEDIVVWVNHAACVAAVDHDAMSPHCHITEFSEFKIPIPKSVKRVGEALRQ